jgi:hypothetical protein
MAAAAGRFDKHFNSSCVCACVVALHTAMEHATRAKKIPSFIISPHFLVSLTR